MSMQNALFRSFPPHPCSVSTFLVSFSSKVAADIHVFTASTTPLVPDGMVAFAICTAKSTATSPTAKSLASNSLTLDALMFVVLPGNPDSDTYNNSNSYPTAAYKGEFVPSSIDTRNAPSTLIPNPRNVAASTSSMFTSLAQEDSALNRSAANPIAIL
ncbi:hypothetical protein B0H14DRAFT_2643071 [Mycena olivaceomarginata]|nr:hypothetical protein B0H14DRAFT_2643071 [Mycena olivaceomarginata]